MCLEQTGANLKSGLLERPISHQLPAGTESLKALLASSWSVWVRQCVCWRMGVAYWALIWCCPSGSQAVSRRYSMNYLLIHGCCWNSYRCKLDYLSWLNKQNCRAVSEGVHWVLTATFTHQILGFLPVTAAKPTPECLNDLGTLDNLSRIAKLVVLVGPEC